MAVSKEGGQYTLWAGEWEVLKGWAVVKGTSAPMS